jgi:gliding motility-associated-like protein
MHLNPHYNWGKTFVIIPLFLAARAFSQCSPPMGPPPSPINTFNSGTDRAGGVLPGSSQDLNWTVAMDSINGTYAPAIVMSQVPSGYYQSPYGAGWISLNAEGQQTGQVDGLFFFKTVFNLPCNNPCGVSYNNPGTYCLGLDFFADNSIYEIYVNGIPQSPNLGGIIPVSNPYSPIQPAGTFRVSLELCNNWQAGTNTLIIVVASTPPIMALLVQSSPNFPPNVSNFIVASICQGGSYQFGNQSLTQSGIAIDTISRPPLCDSIVALELTVNPSSYITTYDTICPGQSISGYDSPGIYLDTFTSVNGCDSVRALNLMAENLPDPNLGTVTSFCLGDSLLLSPGLFSSYLWQDGSTQSQYTVKGPGMYSVTVSNNCGSSTKSIDIVSKTCYINFPNAFTPNHDGDNDIFRVLTSYQFQEFDLSIYNRWGERVFEANNQSIGWDGTFNGVAQEAGTYVWFCRFRNASSPTVMKGFVILVR